MQMEGHHGKTHVQIDQSIFASSGTHAVSYFVSLGIFIHKGRSTQR